MLSVVVTLLFIYMSVLKYNYISMLQGDYSTQSHQVYLPTMKDLEENMPWLLYNPPHKKIWSVVWLDISIEQVLIKTAG